MVRHHEAADAVLRAGGTDDQMVVRADRRARLGVAVVGRRAGDGLGDADALDEIPVRGIERDDRHVEREDEDLAVAERDAAVRDDPEVLEDAAVVRLIAPLHLAGRRVERPDVVVVRRHVHRAARDDGIRLLAAADAGIDRVKVDGDHAPEVVDVRLRDRRERRVSVLVGRVAEAAPADVRAGRRRAGRRRDQCGSG